MISDLNGDTSLAIQKVVRIAGLEVMGSGRSSANTSLFRTSSG